MNLKKLHPRFSRRDFQNWGFGEEPLQGQLSQLLRKALENGAATATAEFCKELKVVPVWPKPGLFVIHSWDHGASSEIASFDLRAMVRVEALDELREAREAADSLELWRTRSRLWAQELRTIADLTDR